MTVSVIIPVADDSRNQYLDQLLSALDRQTIRDFEVLLVIGDHRQGRAINRGVKAATGRWIITLDDDTVITDDRLFEKLVAEMDGNADIGLGGAACEIPDTASSFQKRAMREIPRRYFPRQQHTIDSDFVQHPCLIISRRNFLAIGGEDEELIRGLDPVLRKKVRDHGLRVCIIEDTAVVHLLPGNLRALCRMYRRNGWGSAFAARHYPERVIELTDGYDQGAFVERRPLVFRAVRRGAFLLANVVRFHWIRFATDIAYLLGWLQGRFSMAPAGGSGFVSYSEGERGDRPAYTLRRLRVAKRVSPVDQQIARLHVSSDPFFVLGDSADRSVNFFTDKVTVFRRFAGDGILVESNDDGEVLGFLLMQLDPRTFHRRLLRSGYGMWYLWSVVTGRYRGSPEGWRKWLRLPLAFLNGRKRQSYPDAAKIIAFVVREDQRGKGIGSRLLEQAVALAVQRGQLRLAITVNVDNDGARRLYERSGFSVVDEVLESTGRSLYLVKTLEPA